MYIEAPVIVVLVADLCGFSANRRIHGKHVDLVAAREELDPGTEGRHLRTRNVSGEELMCSQEYPQVYASCPRQLLLCTVRSPSDLPVRLHSIINHIIYLKLNPDS